jgi:hypothetical protein
MKKQETSRKVTSTKTKHLRRYGKRWANRGARRLNRHELEGEPKESGCH